MSALPTPVTKTIDWYPPPQGQWTWDDYLHLPDDIGVRFEVIKGHLYVSPAPTTTHQRLVFQLACLMREHVRANKLGEVLISPIDVRLEDVANPVQPDVVYVAGERGQIVNDANIKGTPSILVEVLSPSRPQYDRQTKFVAYEDVGVPEYWIVDPKNRSVEVFELREDRFELLCKAKAGERLKSNVLPGFAPTVDEIWSF